MHKRAIEKRTIELSIIHISMYAVIFSETRSVLSMDHWLDGITKERQVVI